MPSTEIQRSSIAREREHALQTTGQSDELLGTRQRERSYDAACRRVVELTCVRLEQRDDVPSAAANIEVKPMSEAPASAR